MQVLTVIYGTPADPDAFERYYRDVHIPVASGMRQLVGWRLNWVRDAPGTPDGVHLIATLFTRTASDMAAMLASKEGRIARADLDNFVTGGVRFIEGTEEILR